MEIQEKTHRHDDADIAMTLSNIGLVHKTLGEYDKALPLYQRSLAIYEKSLGSENPTTAAGRKNLSALYELLGEHKQSVETLQHAIVNDKSVR